MALTAVDYLRQTLPVDLNFTAATAVQNKQEEQACLATTPASFLGLLVATAGFHSNVDQNSKLTAHPRI
eukprot:7572377-Pyramimonas_sp.AAC.1